MNAMIVNAILFNIWSVALTHFLTLSFSEYLNSTDANLIFLIQAQNMKFFNYFYKYYLFVAQLFGLAFIAAVYLICKPREEISVKEILLKEQRNKDKLAEDLKNYAT